MLWNGTEASIPSGWHLCDGTMGTPNLLNLIVRCTNGDAGDRPPGFTGGASSHRHGFTGDGHSHTIPPGTGLQAGTDYALETEVDPSIGDTGYQTSMPGYMSLCYIMKL